LKNEAELELVVKALTSWVTGCVEWEPREAERVRNDQYLMGLTPEGIQQDLIDFVLKGGKVRQVKEKRLERSHRHYYYKVIVPYPELFRKGLFVELELFDPDPALPVVLLVNAHEQVN
jgi:hypothetical protein